jgi:selenocysteine lyase/cysteine desulfurase
MDRRFFINRTGLALGAFASTTRLPIQKGYHQQHHKSDTWAQVRAQFDLDHRHIQMAQMLLASHPKPVKDAIEKHRRAFDASPAMYWEEKGFTQEGVVRKAAAEYMNVHPDELALTDSTTQGLSLLYNGLKIKPGDEIISTTHDHYVTDMSLQYASEKKGASWRKIAEYEDPSNVSADEVVSKLKRAITDKTRVVAVTWVHSCTGVKLPIKSISKMIAEANHHRAASERIYFCVDGVHGFGNQNEDISELGCDFFCAGTHKWIFGPRGTGLIWARRNAWSFVSPTVPAFSLPPYNQWLGMKSAGEMTFSDLCTPGGFHAFEHRWALDEAFIFQMKIGRTKIHQRTTHLNSLLKEGLAGLKHVKVFTPTDPALSAGINCFEVNGLSAVELVEKFHEKGIIASSSPYAISYARLTPCIINTEAEVEKSIEVLASIKT